MNQLPQILKRARQTLDLTQEDVAKKLNISQRAYAFYEDEENGRIPKPKRLRELGEILSIPINTLLELYAAGVEQNSTKGTDGHSDNNGVHMDTILPLGNIKITIADYIRRIEQFNDTLSNAINQGLVKIDANLKDVAGKLDVADRAARTDRNLMMETLAVLSGKEPEALLKEADNAEREFDKAKEQDGKTQDAGK